MSQISVGKPDLRTADKRAVALGKFLRHHKLVQSRECILNNERHEFFKIKRAVRALLDPSYEKQRKRVPVLPEIKNEQQAMEALQLFPFNRIAFNVKKLETEVALARGLKPVSGVPCVIIAPQQQFGAEEYWAWFYNPVPITSVLYTVGALAGVVALIAFPLWPYKLRRLGWFLSMGILGFLGFLLVLAVVRLVVFTITFFTVKPGIWLFPNLFEDLGFFESFRPFYSWHGENALPKKQKKKKRVKTEEQRAMIKREADQIRAMSQAGPMAGAGAGAGAAAAGAAAAGGASGQPMPPMPTGPLPGVPANAPPMVQQLMQRAMQQTLMRTEARKQQIIQEKGPLSPENEKALQQKLFQEEAKKMQAELEQMSQHAMAQAQAAKIQAPGQ